MAIKFEDIHQKFDGTLDLCKECEGQCETNEITVFLPNEIEFISKKLNIDPKKFIDSYCNLIRFKRHNIYILKAGICPFLYREKCKLEKCNAKLIRCLLYPVLIGILNNKVRIFVDSQCLMHKKIGKDFRKKAFDIYSTIKKDIPKWWLEFVSEYDECAYDYSKLQKVRGKKQVSLNELRECKLIQPK